MKQEDFEARNRPLWDEFLQAMESLSGGLKKKTVRRQDTVGEGFPAMYRSICHHLAIARARRYSVGLQQRLNQLALDGHQYLYRTRTPLLFSLVRFFAWHFPHAFRVHGRYMLASALLFYGPALCMALSVYLQPEFIYSLLDPYEISGIEAMYDPDNDRLGPARLSDTDALMFGYYIYNNISIGFQTFAGGLLFGIGSIFYLTFNGLYFGAIATHLSVLGYNETFWPFVAGHSSLELTAIVIFGGIGLAVGFNAIAPGRKRRWHAVRDAVLTAMPLVYGGTVMLILAAFVEAFWSSTTWPPIYLKHMVGLSLWGIVILYFWRLGRGESR